MSAIDFLKLSYIRDYIRNIKRNIRSLDSSSCHGDSMRAL